MISNATEDFKKHTLRALPTLVEKLAYVCSLQTETGEYRHWGLIRVYGEKRAHQAIESIHAQMAEELVRIPIRDIYQEYQQAVEKPVQPALLRPDSLVLKPPSNDDELLSAHLQLIQESLAAVAG